MDAIITIGIQEASRLGANVCIGIEKMIDEKLEGPHRYLAIIDLGFEKEWNLARDILKASNSSSTTTFSIPLKTFVRMKEIQYV